eukprot:g1359.t1
MLSRVREEIRKTIELGAPMYNEGNVKGCLRLYRGLAQEVLEDAQAMKMPGRSSGGGGGGSSKDDYNLRLAFQALDDAMFKVRQAPNDDKKNAWRLRHAFDDILAMGPTMQTGDIEDMVVSNGKSRSAGSHAAYRVDGPQCQNPRNCQAPNCNCLGGQCVGSSTMPAVDARLRRSVGAQRGVCKNPGNCQYPQCNCRAADAATRGREVEGMLRPRCPPVGCLRPHCCAYPKCNCPKVCGGGGMRRSC